MKRDDDFLPGALFEFRQLVKTWLALPPDVYLYWVPAGGVVYETLSPQRHRLTPQRLRALDAGTLREFTGVLDVDEYPRRRYVRSIVDAYEGMDFLLQGRDQPL